MFLYLLENRQLLNATGTSTENHDLYDYVTTTASDVYGDVADKALDFKDWTLDEIAVNGFGKSALNFAQWLVLDSTGVSKLYHTVVEDLSTPGGHHWDIGAHNLVPTGAGIVAGGLTLWGMGKLYMKYPLLFSGLTFVGSIAKSIYDNWGQSLEFSDYASEGAEAVRRSYDLDVKVLEKVKDGTVYTATKGSDLALAVGKGVVGAATSAGNKLVVAPLNYIKHFGAAQMHTQNTYVAGKANIQKFTELMDRVDKLAVMTDKGGYLKSLRDVLVAFIAEDDNGNALSFTQAAWQLKFAEWSLMIIKPEVSSLLKPLQTQLLNAQLPDGIEDDYSNVWIQFQNLIYQTTLNTDKVSLNLFSNLDLMKCYNDCYNGFWGQEGLFAGATFDELKPSVIQFIQDQGLSNEIKNDLQAIVNNIKVSSDKIEVIREDVWNQMSDGIYKIFAKTQIQPQLEGAKVAAGTGSLLGKGLNGVKAITWDYTTKPIGQFVKAATYDYTTKPVFDYVVKPLSWTYTTKPVFKYVVKPLTYDYTTKPVFDYIVKPLSWTYTTKPVVIKLWEGAKWTNGHVVAPIVKGGFSVLGAHSLLSALTFWTDLPYQGAHAGVELFFNKNESGNYITEGVSAVTKDVNGSPLYACYNVNNGVTFNCETGNTKDAWVNQKPTSLWGNTTITDQHWGNTTVVTA